MSKAPVKKQKKQRHDPLDIQIRDSEETGILRRPRAPGESKKALSRSSSRKDSAREPRKPLIAAPKVAGKAKEAHHSSDDELVDEDVIVPATMSRKILQQVEDQQRELSDDDMNGAPAAAGFKQRRASTHGLGHTSKAQRERDAISSIEKLVAEDEDDEDVESDDEELVAADYEAADCAVSPEDEKTLNMFMPETTAVRRTLADIIFERLSSPAGGPGSAGGEEALRRTLDPKVVHVYTEVGKYLNKYTSGKIPKAFKIVPTLRNWEEILWLTAPSQWSCQAMCCATRVFASNLNPKMAQRFYNLVLLPKVREDIQKNKKLNYHLYAAIKKSVFKPAAFFKGILLPLAEQNCEPMEAVVLASILAKCSIPVLHASVALLKLSEMPYSGPTALFMKTLLNKKYSLPYRVLDAMCTYFCQFQDDERDLPVVWHQNLLVFAQRYKHELTPLQRENIKMLLRKKVHRTITDEIRRELFAPQPINLNASVGSVSMLA